jgi:hypothetical protein
MCESAFLVRFKLGHYVEWGAGGVWRVFWQRRDLKRRSYEPKPEVKSVVEFASLVNEDAHACCFG